MSHQQPTTETRPAARDEAPVETNSNCTPPPNLELWRRAVWQRKRWARVWRAATTPVADSEDAIRRIIGRRSEPACLDEHDAPPAHRMLRSWWRMM